MSILFPDSEGGWICEKHKKKRSSQRYGSNCYHCLKAKNEKLKRALKRFGHHDSSCSDLHDVFEDEECICGFEKALKGK